jgi:hypothetical protein
LTDACAVKQSNGLILPKVLKTEGTGFGH